MTTVSLRLYLERELRDRLRGHRLIGELDLEGDLYDRVEGIVGEVAGSGYGHLDRLGKHYPAILAVYLVGQGVHNWHGLGGFWGNLSIDGFRQQVAGPQFESALRTLDLETFDALVEAERAHRYLARILIHGGIPDYSVPDLFRLVLHDLKQGAIPVRVSFVDGPGRPPAWSRSFPVGPSSARSTFVNYYPGGYPYRIPLRLQADGHSPLILRATVRGSPQKVAIPSSFCTST